ncbi:MAG TPA: ribbon-helix-helix domain-containing protein [Acidobacteriaceae bacterium]|nr:ribbon-helix-helix domain-containing protein [Acidobacteriaceae bacterium]
MKPQKTVSFRIDADKVEALDKIAANMKRDRTFLLNEAVEAYLEWNAEFEHLIRQGQEDVRRGRWVDHEDVRRRMESIGKRRKSA